MQSTKEDDADYWKEVEEEKEENMLVGEGREKNIVDLFSESKNEKRDEVNEVVFKIIRKGIRKRKKRFIWQCDEGGED